MPKDTHTYMNTPTNEGMGQLNRHRHTNMDTNKDMG